MNLLASLLESPPPDAAIEITDIDTTARGIQFQIEFLRDGGPESDRQIAMVIVHQTGPGPSAHTDTIVTLAEFQLKFLRVAAA